MAKAMYAAEGVGLAATQVGINKRLAVIDAGNGLLKLANPEIVKAWCKKLGEEGCLSFPEIRVKIRRPQKVVVEALNQDSQKVKIEAEGLLARVLQHEIDHLNGVVIIDRIGLAQKLMVAVRLLKLKKKRTSNT
jgi:peptide deformylase